MAGRLTLFILTGALVATALMVPASRGLAHDRGYHFFDAPGITCEFNRPCEYRNYPPRHYARCGRLVVERYWYRHGRCWVTVVTRTCGPRAW